MNLRSPCDEPGCLNTGCSHPINDDWVSPRLYCIKHRKGKARTFLDEMTAIRRYGKGWRDRATETRP
jgi:hypothetical protein